MTRTLRAIVYGDVNLNILDGSAIWVQSMSEALSRAGVDVRVLLKAPVETGRLVDPLRALPGVSVVDPFTSGMTSERTPLSADAAVSLIERLDGESPADLIVVRGLRLVTVAAASPRLRGRLWTYLTDIPQSPLDIDDEQRDRLAAIIDPLLIAVRTGDGAHAWRGALLAAADDGEAGEIFRAWFAENVKIPLRHILAEQALKGTVRRDWDIDLATELLFGPIWHRLIAMRGPVPEIYRTRLVDTLLRAIAPV